MFPSSIISSIAFATVSVNSVLKLLLLERKILCVDNLYLSVVY